MVIEVSVAVVLASVRLVALSVVRRTGGTGLRVMVEETTAGAPGMLAMTSQPTARPTFVSVTVAVVAPVSLAPVATVRLAGAMEPR
jgi:hypothetical protein